MKIEGVCHCGNTGFTVYSQPPKLTSCNCSSCYRYGALWAYAPPCDIERFGEAHTIAYAHGEASLAFHFCKTCGGLVYWISQIDERFAVNMRMADATAIEGIAIRNFDGKDSFEFLD